MSKRISKELKELPRLGSEDQVRIIWKVNFCIEKSCCCRLLLLLLLLGMADQWLKRSAWALYSAGGRITKTTIVQFGAK